jgi:hypothetical protein
MAMEFGKYSKMTVGDVAKDIVTEGGSVVAGLIGAGVLGKQVEKYVKVATPASSMTDKALAYVGNNLPKVGAYWALGKYGGKMLGGYEKDMGKGILCSVVLDTLIRLDNNYAPMASPVKLFGIEFLSAGTSGNMSNQTSDAMQSVLRENSSLRSQLNSALQRVASATPNVIVTPMVGGMTQVKVANNMNERQRVVPPVGTLGLL